jgi:hypothetical protein
MHRLAHADTNQVCGFAEEPGGRFLVHLIASSSDLGDYPTLDDAFEALAEFG